MYYLIEDSLSGLTILKTFYSFEEAKAEKWKMETSESGKWCDYFITQSIN
tara:strand:+ start:363 stop:512 length:150 start_codon:yes stop_codon:yes gene_type:complete